MKKIAIPTSRSKTQFFLNQTYPDYIIGAGYDPVFVVQSQEIKAMDKHCISVAKTCDGLILPGGIDIDPIFYRESNMASYKTDPQKDVFERMLLWAFVDEGKPIFGICRGFQLLAREYLKICGPGVPGKSGTNLAFFQNVSSHNDPTDLEVDRSQPTSFAYADGRLLYPIENEMGQEDIEIAINSIHHQALTLIGSKIDKFNPTTLDIGSHGVRIAAWEDHSSLKPKGIIIEAMSFGTFFKKSKVVGVQWHPEELKDFALLHNVFGTDDVEEKQPKKIEAVVEV